MSLNKMVVLLTASLFCSAAAIFHQPYYPAADPYNFTGKLQYYIVHTQCKLMIADLINYLHNCSSICLRRISIIIFLFCESRLSATRIVRTTLSCVPVPGAAARFRFRTVARLFRSWTPSRTQQVSVIII